MCCDCGHGLRTMEDISSGKCPRCRRHTKGAKKVENAIVNAKDRFYQASTDKWMHRCAQCWTTRLDGSGVAFNNGYEYEENGLYQHAPSCSHRGEF